MPHLRPVAVPPCPDTRLTGVPLPLGDYRALYARYGSQLKFLGIREYQRRLEVDN